MKDSSIKLITAGIIAVILVATLSMISYRIIDAYCLLTADEHTDPTVIQAKMSSLKDWGGLVLGFFFGAAFNFITLVVVGTQAKPAKDVPATDP